MTVIAELGSDTIGGTTHDLEAGHLLYLPAGEPHSLRGIEAGSLLLTIVLPRQLIAAVVDSEIADGPP